MDTKPAPDNLHGLNEGITRVTEMERLTWGNAVPIEMPYSVLLCLQGLTPQPLAAAAGTSMHAHESESGSLTFSFSQKPRASLSNSLCLQPWCLYILIDISENPGEPAF